MEEENEKVPPESEINGCDGSDTSKPNACGSPVVAGENSASQPIAAQTSADKSLSDSFYEKLNKLFESSGLSLVFNFRKTTLDLYQFYKEVTERGGFHQVTKDQKWGEVASALTLKSSVSHSMLPAQLQGLYANLLYQFEQTYYYRTPTKLAATPGIISPGHSSDTEDTLSCSTGKRKHCDSACHLSTVHSGSGDGPMEKKKCNNSSCQLSAGPRTAEQKLPLQTSSKNKEMKKDPNAPPRFKTAYQIFLRKECDRLKKIHGESSGSQNIRNMAIEAWRHLSEGDRQPYIEASRKDKERFNQEMDAYEEFRNKQNTITQNMSSSSKPNVIDFSMPCQTDGDYHVTWQPDAGNFSVPDESTVELAIQLMKNARPNDPIFQINWDEYCESLDMPT